ncbi:MAG: methylenetetrahydrofolate reductase [candidate division Zixibacteria bacterium]|nr:methylenetetrahydrofolate reductase [candidate division Zixibacteria bacterium]
MFVTEHLERADRPLFSYEIIPPPRGRSARDLLSIVEHLIVFRPPFIDITSHSAEAVYEELPDGTVRRRIRNKRPGTISLCGIIQNRYNIDTVPHLLCRGFTREETEDALIELNFLGIHNVLAIRGDETNYKPPVSGGHSVNVHPDELVRQIADLRAGTYLEEVADPDPVEMCVGVGGYPEKHVESPNMQTEIQRLKAKVDSGADYIVTQMFFDNEDYFRFVDNCRAAGILVPIIPGLKVINSVHQLSSLPRNFHITLPDVLVGEIQTNRKHVRTIGRAWAIRQCEELMARGVKCVHFFVVNDADSVFDVVKKLQT